MDQKKTEIVEFIKNNFDIIANNYTNMNQEFDSLKEENEKLKEENKKYKKINSEIEEKYNNIKLAKSITGNSDNSHTAKLKVNRIVREIDKCIALLNR